MLEQSNACDEIQHRFESAVWFVRSSFIIASHPHGEGSLFIGDYLLFFLFFSFLRVDCSHSRALARDAQLLLLLGAAWCCWLLLPCCVCCVEPYAFFFARCLCHNRKGCAEEKRRSERRQSERARLTAKGGGGWGKHTGGDSNEPTCSEKHTHTATPWFILVRSVPTILAHNHTQSLEGPSL